jgi:hypothetical protein
MGTLKAVDTLTIPFITGGANSVGTLDLNGKGVTVSANANNITKIANTTATASTLTLDPAVTSASWNSVEVGAGNITVVGTLLDTLTVTKLSTPDDGHLIVPATAVTLNIGNTAADGGKFAYATAPASVTLGGNGDVTVVGALSTAGTLTKAYGNLTVEGNLSAGTVVIGANLTVNGNLTSTVDDIGVSGYLEVTGSLSLADDLTVGGAEIKTVSSFTAAAVITATNGDVTITDTIATIGAGKTLITAGTGTVWLTGAYANNSLGPNIAAENIGVKGVTLGTLAGLDTGKELHVKGTLTIAGSVEFEFAASDTSRIVLQPGGKIAISTATAFLKDAADQEGVVLAVLKASEEPKPVTFTKAVATKTGTDWTVTTEPITGTGSGGAVILGLSSFTFGTAATPISGADADASAAAGSITAGVDTIVAFAGITP